ncbi:CapA family protein [Oceanobacillus halotolerans]|uniref:CapA family protein n=1 Tax=Oceanobacillus halotolerans TaxID=2663380 RepID=UPI0013D92816|nr:CapA family protein [Oceanobacillus halotolerans]
MKRTSLLLGVVCIFLVTACTNQDDTLEYDKEMKRHSLISSAYEEKDVPTKKQITLAAVGDMLIHDRVYRDAQTEDGYDFKPMLKEVKPYLDHPTVTFANQETMIGGDGLPVASYPSFNSPVEVGDALKHMGVDVVSIANNHTLDHGEVAIQHATRHWNEIDMMYVGAHKDKKDRNELRIYNTEEGISVAFLAYTYGTNGIPVPDGKDYLVNLINRKQMKQDIAEATERADVVVLSLHFGKEYKRMPSKEQKSLAQFAADQGVDVILGHHPHVLQPVDWVEGAEGNKTFVAYSLGNFLSGQYDHYRRIGGVLQLTIVKDEQDQGVVEVTSPKFLPTYVKDDQENDYRVLPMFSLSNDILPDAKEHYEKIKNHIAQWTPELEFIEEK